MSTCTNDDRPVFDCNLIPDEPLCLECYEEYIERPLCDECGLIPEKVMRRDGVTPAWLCVVCRTVWDA